MNDICLLCSSKNYRFLGIKNHFNVVRCNICSLTYIRPLPSKRSLEKLYEKFDYSNALVAEKVIRKDALESLIKIERFTRMRSLIDIGCGRGYFLDEARKRKWIVFGIDYSNEVIGYASKDLYLPVERADIFSFKSKRKFDVVTLNQVIEHVTQPNLLIEQCNKLLNPGGLLYIATPNISSLLAKLKKLDFDYLMPPEHIGYYNYETLSRLLNDNGFTVLKCSFWSYSSDLAGLIKRLIKRKEGISLAKNKKKNTSALNYSLGKKLKHLLFDRFFCEIFYRVLNLRHWGTIIEIIAVKQ